MERIGLIDEKVRESGDGTVAMPIGERVLTKLKLEPDRKNEKGTIANSIGTTLPTSVGKEMSGYSRENNEGNYIYLAK